MREIKFRAWNKDTKKINLFVEMCSYTDGSLSVSAGVKNLSPIGNTEDFILMQFTGLQDKNGKDIYESDIVLHKNCKYEIVFWEGAFIRCGALIHDNALTNYACCRTFEVIGNVHENPDLLK